MGDAARGPMPRRWSTPVLLPAVGLLLGSCVGLATNTVNAAVSTDYYAAVLGSAYGSDTMALIRLHGIVEGGILGLLFGLVVAVAAAASSQLRLPLRSAVASLALAVAVTVACWTLGGVAGSTWATVDPRSFQGAFPPSLGFDGPDLRRFAWVGGTIWGAYAGTAVAAAVACVHLHHRWRARVARDVIGTAFAVRPGPSIEPEATDVRA